MDSPEPDEPSDDSQVPYGRIYVAPVWMQPAAATSAIVAVAAFVASFTIGGGTFSEPDPGLLSAALNPLVWVGVILAGFWWGRIFQSGLYNVCPHCRDRARRQEKVNEDTVLICARCRSRYRKA